MPARSLRPAAAVLAAAGLCWAVAGCGGSGAGHGSDSVVSAHSICLGSARDAIARTLKLAPRRIKAAKSIGGDAAPQCRFEAPGSARVSVLVNVQHIQDAYFVLERTIEEAAQVFAPAKPEPAPLTVGHLGLDASWFPGEQWLQSTDGRRLVIVTIGWSGASQARKIALSAEVARTYLHTPRGKAAAALSKMSP